MATLVHLAYSPWSEKARWAIDHHGLEVRRRAFLPIFGGPVLRLVIRRWSGRATVPVLIDGDEVLTDSLDIARWADQRGSGPALFPERGEPEIEHLNALGERLLSAGRARTTSRAISRPGVLRESIPAPLARLGSVGNGLGWVGARLLARKYAFDIQDTSDAHAVLRSGLEELRARLGSREYVLDTFSWADVVLGVGLQFIRPVADAWLRLGPESRLAWTEPELAEEFADLVDWRDRLYAAHRVGRSSARAGTPPRLRDIE